LNIRFLSLTSAMALLAVTAAYGQSPFPSVSGQPQQQQPSAFPPVSGGTTQPPRQPTAFPSVGGGTAPSAFPSVSGAPSAAPVPMSPAMPGGFGAPGGFSAPQQQEAPCMADFVKLRGETERRGKLIQAASKRKAPPDEACKLLTNFVEADQKMLKFVETNAKSCGIPPAIPAEMKKNHTSVQQLRSRVCAAAQAGAQQRPQGPSFSDVLGTSSLPEATTTTRSGGSTFDTLSGNALAR
jgi:hypothetical protein